MLTTLIYTGGAVAAVSILAASAVACCLLASRRPAERFDQHARTALAVTQPPAVARNAPAPARGAGPGVPPPGPRHDTGGLLYTIRTWRCGCVLAFDGEGRITGTHACTPTDLDEELRRLTP